MRIAALIIGSLVIALGVVGLVAPELLMRLVTMIQMPPAIYLAAVLRVAFGVVLILAAPTSRVPSALRVFGAVMILGGVLTPFFGAQIADIILNRWSHGPGTIRYWAAAAIALGAFIVYATGKRRAA